MVPFDNTYARLPERFFARIDPTPVAAPRLIRVNETLATLMGIDPKWLASPEGVEFLAGNRVLPESEPIAMAYAGHQFGGFVPQLGDGRAILLGEVAGTDGQRRDIHLKGSGPTPFSRRGDGRAALGPVLREYVVSEGMAALGIPTTRALGAVTTGEKVYREEVVPGGVFARVAASHIRVGTFEYFSCRDDKEALRILADHVIARHYPEAGASERPYHALLESVISAQAQLIAGWLLVGFIHGVMNTDNMAVSGETIDYGPCAFLDHYDPKAVFSYIDRGGRYAFSNQPGIAQWNLTRLAECLLPLMAENPEEAVPDAKAALEKFAPQFEAAYQAGLRRKLGLTTVEEGDAELGWDLMRTMADSRADFTLTFRYLADSAEGNDSRIRGRFLDPAAFDVWAVRWRERLAKEPMDPAERAKSMRAVNPLFIPRNHRIEAAIRAAVDRDDFAPFHELVDVLARPFEDQLQYAQYAEPPQEDERVLQTFCGT